MRLTSDGGEANEMLLFHGMGATKPQARRGSEEVVEHKQGLDSRFVSGRIQAGDLPCGESGVPPIGYAKLSAMKNRVPVDP